MAITKFIFTGVSAPPFSSRSHGRSVKEQRCCTHQHYTLRCWVPTGAAHTLCTAHRSSRWHPFSAVREPRQLHLTCRVCLALYREAYGEHLHPEGQEKASLVWWPWESQGWTSTLAVSDHQQWLSLIVNFQCITLVFFSTSIFKYFLSDEENPACSFGHWIPLHEHFEDSLPCFPVISHARRDRVNTGGVMLCSIIKKDISPVDFNIWQRWLRKPWLVQTGCCAQLKIKLKAVVVEPGAAPHCGSSSRAAQMGISLDFPIQHSRI